MVSAKLENAVIDTVPQAKPPLVFERISTGKFNTSWFVRDAAAHDYVLRVAPPPNTEFVFYERDMMRQEPDLHTLLLEKTTIPVPRILAFDDSRTRLDRSFLVMERLPGRPISEATGIDVDSVFRQVGRCLAQAHALTAPAFGYLGAHHPMPPKSNWSGAFHTMWDRLIADVARVGHYSLEEQTAMRQLLDKHIALFVGPARAALLHMDVWAQNILVDEAGTLTGLVDWDRSLCGDPEIEFAVLDYCGVSTPAFWEGYGKERDMSPEARVRQVFYLLYEMQKYIVIRQGRNEDPAGAQRYKRQVFGLVRQALGEHVGSTG